MILADLKAEKLAYNDIFALEQFGLYADLRNSPNPDADVERLKLKAFTAYKRPVQKSSPSVSAAPAEASAAVKQQTLRQSAAVCRREDSCRQKRAALQRKNSISSFDPSLKVKWSESFFSI